ncbi:hypothetical protein BV25DRAFT_1821745 [Artomyces pyxidatus]|uniref:Uncharacterized protein n=1 Tax=Artomyces pyxidatus TaxID=48021 RepID=A0ACB8TBH0_9AGAM|nr:hypothetical protein BV25DRAFT_1821745 [Artomyces pyxidatus]
MASDALQRDVLVNVDAPPSPSSSVSSLDDTINNPMGRVYFGPMQSPEKKFVSKTARRQTLRTPPVRSAVRRSARLSTAPGPIRSTSPSDEDEEAVLFALGGSGEGSGSSREGTLDKDPTLFDDIEPTSALASKITRAHDNPSPPPRMQDLLDRESESPLISGSPQSPPLEYHSSSNTPTVRRPDSPVVPQARLPQTPFPSTSSPEAQRAIPSADLIFFDASPLDVAKQDAGSSINGPATYSLPQVPDDPSYIDLLAASPVRVRERDGQGQSPIPTPLALLGDPPVDVVGKGKATDSSTPCKAAPQDSLIDIPAREPISDTAPHLVASSSTDKLTVPNTSEALLSADASPRVRRSPRLSRDNSSAETSLKTTPEPSPRILSPSRSPDAKMKAAITASPQRVLGSLSPGSAIVLSNLLSTSTDADPHSSNKSLPVSTLPSINELPSTPQRPVSTFQTTAPMTLQGVQRPPASQSPWRNRPLNPSSPTRRPFDLNDPTRTPARRIPIEQAIAQASKSGQKLPISRNPAGPSTGLFGVPVFTRQALDDPSRSPARRVPLAGPSSPAKLPISGSPIRPPPRSGSAEPQSARKPFVFFKPPSKSLSDSEVASPKKLRAILPFPLRPGNNGPTSQLPESIPEEREPVASTSKLPRIAPPNFSPPKSSLRQPSTLSGSKIPRVGAKPYARPPDKAKPINPLLAPARRAAARPVPTKPPRLVKSSNGGGSSTEDLNPQVITFSVPLRGSQSDVGGNPPSSPLKRKRAPDEGSSSKGPPMAFRSPASRMLSPMKFTSSIAVPSAGGPTAAPKPRQMRRVGDVATKLPPAPVAPIVQDTVQDPEAQLTPQSPAAADTTTAVASSSPPRQGEDDRQVQEISSPAEPQLDPLADAPIDTDNDTEPSSSRTRRATRSRKTVQSPSNGTVVSPPLIPRRRVIRAPVDTGAFSSMSAVALKALTNSNTEKNQQSIALLEREVVRKPGNRPDSPTTKVRTVLERQKEERGRGRKERAERRARRGVSEGLDGSEVGETSFMSSDDLEPTGPDGKPIGHRRGPGDDEDYETPEKHARPTKRVRLGSPNDGIEENRETKRVRWDRGLFNTIYFEDVRPNVGERAKSVPPASKGVLAGSAKALRLDSLGNLVNSSTPLTGIVPESVVVKKFVYDNDVVEEPSKPAVSVAKGKGKRAKSTG